MTLPPIATVALAAAAAPAESPSGGGSVWPLVSLVFFVALFVLMLAWLLFSRKERWARDASIPLSEEPVEPRRAGMERGSETPR